MGHRKLRAGDVLDVMPPVGEFTIDPDPSLSGHRVAIAAGSGITPVLSLIATTLEMEPGSSWTLLYGNRTANSVMFLEELEGLKDRYPDRFQLFHLLSREGSDLPFLSGRIDEEKIRVVHDRLLGGRDVAGWYLCGPYDMVMTARRTLEESGSRRRPHPRRTVLRRTSRPRLIASRAAARGGIGGSHGHPRREGGRDEDDS